MSGKRATGGEHGRIPGIPLGPHRVPMISCSNCGTEHHPDAARSSSDESGSQCRECSAYLRDPTETEERQFTHFIVWNGRHLDRDREDSEILTDGGQARSGSEHIVTVEATRVFSGDVEPGEAELLTYDGTSRDILGREYDNQGVPMAFDTETKRTYECSCGRRFRKPETAREHLENNRSRDTGSSGSGGAPDAE